MPMFNILVVEDDFHTRKPIADVLKDERYTPVLVQDACSPKHFRTPAYWLMITDIMMPEWMVTA